MKTSKRNSIENFVIEVDGKIYPINYANKAMGIVKYTDENNVGHTVSSFILKKTKAWMRIQD